MTYSEIVAMIGKPFDMERELPLHKEGSVTVVGRMVPTKDPNGDHVMLNYSRPVRWVRTYPMLWVHLKSGHVTEIYAKQYFGFGIDDDGIYGYSIGKQPWGGGVRFRETFAH